MLRILSIPDTTETASHARIQLVGQVHGEWVPELRRLVTRILLQADRLDIDMAEVSFVDADGLKLIQELAGSRVALVNCALFVAEQLKTLELDV
jgi:anti-anti-sigma regulatory factor